MRFIKRLISGALFAALCIALLDQFGRKPKDRDWHGRVLGIPYDFRPPTPDRVMRRFWNPKDERILVPHIVGIGWTVNLYQVKRRAQLLIA